MDINLDSATFGAHLEELRKTLIKMLAIIMGGVFLCFCFYKQIYALLIAPVEGESIMMLSPIEGFSAMLKLSFWVGLFATSPAWLYAFLKFVAPALNQREKAAVPMFFILTSLFAVIGFLFGYTITLPIANEALASFNRDFGENHWCLEQYLDYTLTLLLAHGLVFEFAAILLVLLHYGFINPRILSTKRSYAYVAIFIIAAVLTPPDVLTQLMLGIPMTGLYELLILYGKLREKSLNLQRETI